MKTENIPFIPVQGAAKSKPWSKRWNISEMVWHFSNGNVACGISQTLETTMNDNIQVASHKRRHYDVIGSCQTEEEGYLNKPLWLWLRKGLLRVSEKAWNHA